MGIDLKNPTSFVKTRFGHEVEVSRCRADGMIVFQTQESLSRHGGHYLLQPVNLSMWERFKIWGGWY
jgi:hypothetical protein